MTKGQWFMGGMVMVAGFLVGMCGREDTPVPTMSRPAGINPPSTEPIADTEAATRLAELQYILEPGASTFQKMPDGKEWAVFSNGIGVQVISPGAGATGRAGMRATVAYTATLANAGADTGKVVEKYTQENPLIFNVASRNQMKGLSFALMRLSVGGHERVWVPAGWAYGATGKPPNIPPGQALILDLHFIRIAGASVEVPKPESGGDGTIDLHFLDTPMGPTTAKAGEKN